MSGQRPDGLTHLQGGGIRLEPLALHHLTAHQDGMLRRVIPMRDGSFGDVIVFSVSDAEWPTIRETLSAKLAARPRPA